MLLWGVKRTMASPWVRFATLNSFIIDIPSHILQGVLASRPPIIPPSVLARRSALHAAAKRRRLVARGVVDLPAPMDITTDDTSKEITGRKTDRQLELEAEREGEIFIINLRDHWKLQRNEEANDIIPEIMDGHNVFDFFDDDIESRLNKLEKQESALEATGFYEEADWTRDPDAKNPKVLELRQTAERYSPMSNHILFVSYNTLAFVVFKNFYS